MGKLIIPLSNRHRPTLWIDYRETQSELIVRQVYRMLVDTEQCVCVTNRGPDGFQHWCQDSVSVSLPAALLGAN